MSKTFYKRPLPCPPAIEFSSDEGRKLFCEALGNGTMEGFFKLVEQFRTQDEPAFCGLATLAMVLNALSIDPGRSWKAPWRWFNENMLDCCKPLEKVKEEGIAFKQVVCLGKCNGADVVQKQFGTFTEDEFRRDVSRICTSRDEHLVVSYSRRTFSQTGDGHFSPIGGFHRGLDLILILDTARFKYPPHWVPLTMMYESMARIDPSTGQPRGYMSLKPSKLALSLYYTLDRRSSHVQNATAMLQTLQGEIEKFLRTGLSVEELVSSMVHILHTRKWMEFVSQRPPCCGGNTQSTDKVKKEVGQDIKELPLYKIVCMNLDSSARGGDVPDRLVMLLLLLTDKLSGSLPGTLRKEWDTLFDVSHSHALKKELSWLKDQLSQVLDMESIITSRECEGEQTRS